MVTQVVNKNTKSFHVQGHDVSNTLFWSSTHRTGFLSYFVDIISHLDRMLLCKISFSKTYSVSRIFNFFCRLLCYPFSLFIPLQPRCADGIKNCSWIRKKWHDTRLSNSSCRYSCVCEMWCDVNCSVSFSPSRFRLHCVLHQWCQRAANCILIKSADGWRMKDQLDVTCSFISLIMRSTCFGH